MNRNIAFFITSNRENDINFINAKRHFTELAKRFNYEFWNINNSFFNVFIIFEGNISINSADKSYINFPIGNLGDFPLECDRFLKVVIKNDLIIIQNDYVGSIPVYYSNREYLSLSNIEPCVMLDTNTTIKDLSYENIYGFLRFSHFIWDETTYQHIFMMLPDSEYRFDSDLDVSNKYMNSVYSSIDRIEFSNIEISNDLNKLNDKLVRQSLQKYNQIILPLSSGYDSRMILASLSKRADLRDKVHCFTYGSVGSVEVEAGRRLAKKAGVKWNFIDLPLRFLEMDCLSDVHNIFGSSMHMHGMYQIEFWNEICKVIDVKDDACLTSGFMTGVPAGQHNSILNIRSNQNLAQNMNAFSQSRFWSENELEGIEVFKNKKYSKTANKRFKMAFDRFDGEIFQKSVVFDVWTRQRNFIGYYPRTLEWKIPVISPHMNSDYINFFMSISKKHLDDRFAVELMFSKHYEKMASIVSNSNGIKSINNSFENFMFFMSRVFRKLKIGYILPKKYANKNFEFNVPSIRHSKENAVYPLLSDNQHVHSFIQTLVTRKELEYLYHKAYKGNVGSYNKLTTLQSLGFSILKMNNSYEC